MFYTINDFKKAIADVGISKGDTLFMHTNIGFFGLLHEAKVPEDTAPLLLEAIFDIIGDEGTVVVPTFSYSFGSDQPEKVFDVNKTPSKMGTFAEFVRKHNDSVRSHDPMFSVAAIGHKKHIFTKDVSYESFGINSFWDRFLHNNGKICNFNCDSGSTFIHYVENMLKVNYRKNIEFKGHIIDALGNKVEHKNIFFCRLLEDSSSSAYFEEFDRISKLGGYTRHTSLGRGSVLSITAKDTYDVIQSYIKEQPFFLTRKFLECLPIV